MDVSDSVLRYSVRDSEGVLVDAESQKGSRLRFLQQDRVLSGDAFKLGDGCQGSGKSYLFFLTPRSSLKWDYP